MFAGKFISARCKNCHVKVYPNELLVGIIGGLVALGGAIFIINAVYFQKWLALILYLFAGLGIFILIGLYSPLSYKKPKF